MTRSDRGIAWPELMALGLGRLRLAPEAFWAMTPREFAAAAGVGAPRGRCRRADLLRLLARFPDDIRAAPSPAPAPCAARSSDARSF